MVKLLFFADLIDTVTERGRRLLALERGNWTVASSTPGQLLELSQRLLSIRGEASGVALARSILDGYFGLSREGRLAFLGALNDEFGPDTQRLDHALRRYQEDPGPESVRGIHDAAEPRRQELIRRLNMAVRGTRDLVRMRADMLDGIRSGGPLAQLDADFLHLFSSWFNRGFLVLQPVDWTTPANILEKVIRYEAVHEIQDWHDLRRRLEPDDRRCFAFFHPQLADEPLIFVEVALMQSMPAAIAPLLSPERAPIAAREATHAVFYSISNCQPGLAGVSFGNFLIKQVVEELKRQFSNLKTFVTLSPVPGFSSWLRRELHAANSAFMSESLKAQVAGLIASGNEKDADRGRSARDLLMPLAAAYLLKARLPNGKPVDPVARFHLGNGARLECLHWMGDTSPKGIAQAEGLMVNYLYDLDSIVENHESFANSGTIHASATVRKLLRPDRTPPGNVATPSNSRVHR